MYDLKAPFLLIPPWFNEHLWGQDLGAVDVSHSNDKYWMSTLLGSPGGPGGPGALGGPGVLGGI